MQISVIFKQVISKEVKQQYTVISYADNNVRVVETTIKKGSVEKAHKQINRIEVVLNQYIAKGLSVGNGSRDPLVTCRQNQRMLSK